LDGTESDAESTTNLFCDHYSRDFLSDFLYTSTATIPNDVADLVVSNVKAEECAKSCVAADGFECDSFNYCPSSMQCLLNKGTGAARPGQSSNNTDSCLNYKSMSKKKFRI